MRGERSAAAPTESVIGPSIAIFIGLAGVTAALTGLFLGMRSVMEIGGACAEGNTPFVPTRPCPQGVAVVMIGGVWAGLVFAAVYAWQAFKHGVPNFVGLLWPALFISLGFNFLQFGVDPPGEGVGLAWGWLVPGVLFVLMGGIPLVLVAPWLIRRFTGLAAPSPASGGMSAGQVREALSAFRNLRRAARTLAPRVSRTDPAAHGAASDLVSDLERLDTLHRSGGLSDEQYKAAKSRLLGPEGSP